MRNYEAGIEIEAELLKAYENCEERRDASYENITHEGMVRILHLKNRTNSLFKRRCDAARDVIDMIAKRVGIDPESTYLFLYAPDPEGSSPIIAKMDEYFGRGGDKVKLKKRIGELEAENAVLRSLIQK